MNSILIKNGTIITHDKTIFNQDILINDGKIQEIATGISPSEDTAVIDASGQYVLPGLVDMHCDIKDPGYDYMEEFATVNNAAIAGGYTSITANPLTHPVVDNKAVVEYIYTKSRTDCLVNVYPYGSLTVGGEGTLVSEIGEMQLAGVIAVSDGDKPIQDSFLMHNILEYSKMFDMPVILHNEDLALSKNSGVTDGVIATKMGIVGASSTAESSHVARNILLAEELNAKIHLTHISTARSVALIRDAKKRNVKVTAETSPQYVSLTEEDLLGFNAFCKMNPPLRSREDVNALKQGIADGTIDVISSDHKPNAIDSKTVEFELASFGMPGLELALSIAYTALVEPGIVNMETLVGCMSTNPASILTLNKGRIIKDGVADMIIFDPKVTYKVDSNLFQSKAKYSPYDQKTLKGLVTHTIIGGRYFNPSNDYEIIDTNETKES